MMRIPAEALAYYLNESDNRTLADGGNRAEPVEPLPGLRTALPNTFAERRHPPFSDGSDESHLAKLSARHWNRRFEERRKHQRRQQDLPVMLDTRLYQRRQESMLYPAINDMI